MIFTKLSPKQLKSMLWWGQKDTKDYDAIVCDGSVRSGKTMSMTIGFVLWSGRVFDGENLAFCGKTIDSLKRNVITPLQKWLGGIVKFKINLSKNYMDITVATHTNRYYMFGGKDESSYQLIQGITLAGVLFDEVALMPKSFVDQALACCSVSGSKFWFNCNPESSKHWFYKEWILKSDEKNALHLHFTMEDNFSLSDEVKKRYKRSFSGVFYDRYIKGLWVLAEGLVYQMHFGKAPWTDKNVYSLRLEQAIVRELADVSLNEMTAKVSNERLDKVFQSSVRNLNKSLQKGLATGAMVIKPVRKILYELRMSSSGD